MKVRIGFLAVVIAFGVGVAGVGLEGCASNRLGDIESSQLSELDKASARLYMAESGWVQAKTVLADVLVELSFAGVELSDDAKARMKGAIDSGNQSLRQCRAMLERGDISTAGAFAVTLRSLQTATTNLTDETKGIR